MTFRMSTVVKNAFARMPSAWQRNLKDAVDARARAARLQAAERQLVRLAAGLSENCLAGVGTKREWEQRRADVRRHLLSALGLEPFPPRIPLRPAIAGTWERPGYRAEKIVFESLPGLQVAANFYLPKNAAGPVPCIVYLNGHWPSLDGAKTGFQDRYLWYPAHGFALLVLDPMGFGEIPGVHPGTNRLGFWHWLSLGYTPAGVEVWNAMRALDWLAERSEVDAARIGVTGISGGGVMTQFLAALDDRVTVAAPSCSTYTIGSQVALGLVPQQCDCTFFPNTSGLDFPEILALIAPRPLLVLGGRKDPIFPPAGFRAAFRRASRIYDLYRAPDAQEPRIRLVESGHGHADPPASLRETRQWLCRWLQGQAAPSSWLDDPGPTPEPPEFLRCTRGIPRAALNAGIQDQWIPIPARTPPASPEACARRRTELLEALRSTTFAWFPKTEAPFRTRKRAGSGGYAGLFANFQEYEFDSETGVPIKACLLTPRNQKGPQPLVVWVKGPDDSVIFPDLDEFFPVLRTHALAILSPRFSEQPLSAYDNARIERTASLLGRSLAAMAVWDVLRTVRWAVSDRGISPAGITVYGWGGAGIAGLYAALFDSDIGQVVLRDPPVSHFEGPALPLVLRNTDIDEVAGALAPRRLTLLAHRPDAFPLARAFFDRMGCPESFRRAGSLAEALREDPPGGAPC